MWGKVTEYILILVGFITTTPIVIIGLIGAFILFLMGKVSKSQILQGYSFNILYALDQFGNTLLLGDPDETISSRTGRALLSGQAKWYVYPFGWLVDTLALIFNDKNHVRKSVETHLTYEKELWTWQKSDFLKKEKSQVKDQDQ